MVASEEAEVDIAKLLNNDVQFMNINKSDHRLVQIWQQLKKPLMTKTKKMISLREDSFHSKQLNRV